MFTHAVSGQFSVPLAEPLNLEVFQLALDSVGLCYVVDHLILLLFESYLGQVELRLEVDALLSFKIKELLDLFFGKSDFRQIFSL